MKKILTALFLAVALLSTIPIFSKEVRAENNFEFELPIEGTTGFASCKMALMKEPGKEIVATLYPGIAFTIKGEEGNYFRVNVPTTSGNLMGYVEKKKTLVNLPDIIPSIIYWDSNSVSSLFMSSGEKLPGITDQKLYHVDFYNPRFKCKQFVMPVLYNMAKQVMQAQQAALEDGNSLKIYETYRPYSVQLNVRNTLSNLINSNSKVYNGIASWGKGWFIAQSYSNHQLGKAMDVSLVKTKKTTTKKVGSYNYTVIYDYDEYEMPTQMHELSTAAITFNYGVNSANWKSAPLSSGMNASEGARLLQKYCTSAGMTPLASEWWHFDASNCPSNCKGDFYITSCVSEVP